MSSEELERNLNAAILAVALACGSLGREKVRRTANDVEEIESIFPHSGNISCLSCSPLGTKGQQYTLENSVWEQLISKAASYFRRPESIDVNQAMVAIWNSCDRSFSVSALVACSVLEGLCHQEPEDNPGVFSKAQINAIEAFMRSDNFRPTGGQTLDALLLTSGTANDTN